jgi:hypothetical protein
VHSCSYRINTQVVPLEGRAPARTMGRWRFARLPRCREPEACVRALKPFQKTATAVVRSLSKNNRRAKVCPDRLAADRTVMMGDVSPGPGTTMPRVHPALVWPSSRERAAIPARPEMIEGSSSSAGLRAHASRDKATVLYRGCSLLDCLGRSIPRLPRGDRRATASGIEFGLTASSRTSAWPRPAGVTCAWRPAAVGLVRASTCRSSMAPPCAPSAPPPRLTIGPCFLDDAGLRHPFPGLTAATCARRLPATTLQDRSSGFSTPARPARWMPRLTPRARSFCVTSTILRTSALRGGLTVPAHIRRRGTSPSGDRPGRATSRARLGFR